MRKKQIKENQKELFIKQINLNPININKQIVKEKDTSTNFQRRGSQSNNKLNVISNFELLSQQSVDNNVLIKQIEEGCVVNPCIIEGRKINWNKFNKTRAISCSSSNLMNKENQDNLKNHTFNLTEERKINRQKLYKDQGKYQNLIEAELNIYYLNSKEYYTRETFMNLCNSLGLLLDKKQFSNMELLDNLWMIGSCRKSKANKEIIFELLKTILVSGYKMNENIIGKIFRSSKKYKSMELESLNLNIKKKYLELFQKKQKELTSIIKSCESNAKEDNSKFYQLIKV